MRRLAHLWKRLIAFRCRRKLPWRYVGYWRKRVVSICCRLAVSLIVSVFARMLIQDAADPARRVQSTVGLVGSSRQFYTYYDQSLFPA